MANILDVVLTDNGTADVSWKPSRKSTPNRGTLNVFGTFGGGSATFKQSPVGSSGPFIVVTDAAGNPVDFTTDGATNFEIYANQNPIEEDSTVLRVELSGATAPNIRIVINDAD
jgi:hypothetical protein